jgi:homoserine O-succinyltransferase/O-acetyltransferase
MSELNGHAPEVVIGLVNNMPDAALKPTERQFRNILEEAAPGTVVTFKYFFLPDIPRNGPGRLHLSQSYSSLETLWSSRIDGLIVTGAPPSAFSFEDEPYWGSFCQLVDWTEDRAIPSYWSCLAAHAAVKHLDGIERRPLEHKLSGIFESEKIGDHRLLAGTPVRWAVPHSRYNGLLEHELYAADYRVLSRLCLGGPDIFIKLRNSLAVFAQGHLEYDRNTILYEYRRDLARFVAGESLVRPRIPEGYFDPETAAALHHWSRATLSAPNGADLPSLGRLFENARLADGWRPIAVRFFANWLSFVLETRASRNSKIYLGGRSGQALVSEMEI